MALVAELIILLPLLTPPSTSLALASPSAGLANTAPILLLQDLLEPILLLLPTVKVSNMAPGSTVE